MAAIVVDLSSLRLDRRVDRLGADAAAVAGAAYLRPGDTRDPQQACRSAWAYLVENIGALDPPAGFNGCTSFGGVGAACPLPIEQSSSVGDFTVTVTWPVLINSALMAEPDIQPGAVVAPALDDLADGLDPCARIGVTVTRNRNFVLGPALGATGASTTVHSVARGDATTGTDEIAAAVVLNEDRLATLCAKQGGSIAAASYNDGSTDRPGVIAVDSDGTNDDHGCTDADDYVIHADTEAGTRICADGPRPGPGCDGGGYIDSYAKGPFGNSARAHDPALPATTLAPTPSGVAERIGSAPLFSRYGCATGCDGTPIGDLDPQLANPQASGFTRVQDGDSLPPGGPGAPVFRCDATEDVVIPGGRWFVDCPEFTVSRTVVFSSTNASGQTSPRIAFAGDVTLNGGCLAVNVPVAPAATPVVCPPVTGRGTASATTLPAPLSDARVLLASGADLRKDHQSRLLLPRTFVYQQDGSVNLEGEPGGELLWTAPSGGDYVNLLLWSEGGGSVRIDTGGSQLSMAGVLFAPRSRLRLTGDDPATIQAQLFADTMEVLEADIVLAPDPTAAVPTQRSQVRLIR
jgi:hypothetical protein